MRAEHQPMEASPPRRNAHERRSRRAAPHGVLADCSCPVATDSSPVACNQLPEEGFIAPSLATMLNVKARFRMDSFSMSRMASCS